MLRVGLTGGIACGKTRALARFAARGLATLDLDRVAREVVDVGGAAYDEVVGAFGPRILGPRGRIDRKALGGIVFADATARSLLNGIVHPRIRDAESRWAAEEALRGARVAVTDAALLVESGVHLRFDRLVVVHCPAEEQLRRLMRRDGLGAADARARIDAQMPVEEKRTFAHLEIDASRSELETDQAADAAALGLEGAAGGAGPPRTIPEERALGALAHGPTQGPRGLSPASLLQAIASWGGLEMERAARLLVPNAGGPWYRQARGGEEASPAILAAPIVLWALRGRAPDDDYLASAAASFARLTHSDGVSVADAVAVALALQRALLGGEAPAAGWAAGCVLAARWGRAAPSARVEGDFAAMLSGAARGVRESDAPAEIRAALRTINAS